MIFFEDWSLHTDGRVIAQQFDNLTRTFVVQGDIPKDWEWTMLVQIGDAMDILPLAFMQEGLGIVLTAKQLSLSGYYTMQLRAARGELVRHTNTINVYVPASLSGEKQWPDVPSEFTDLERRATEAVHKAEKAAVEAGNGAGQAAAAEKNAEETKVAAQNAAAVAGQSAANASASERAAAEHRTRAEQGAILAESYTSHPPIVGENGNWWGWDGVQYVDSGKPSQGEQGVQGERGPQGEQGVQGERGPQGEPGDLTAQQGNTFYSNALKGTASGAAIRVDDVSPLEHTVPVKVSGADDPAAVTVKACGKNLFNYKEWVAWCSSSGIGSLGRENDTHLGEDCFSYRLWQVSSGFGFTGIEFKENTSYIFSLELSFTYEEYETYNYMPAFNIHYTDGTRNIIALTEASSTAFKRVTLTTPSNKTVAYLSIPQFGSTCQIYVKKNMQIEVGATATEYEPYTAPVTYPVSEDGTCEVTSIAPTMTLTTDTNGTVMDCEYNRDINKAFEQLTQAIISMGGNV